jgi:oligopeptide/dipeptide ABC transporter ATP-binding protein
MERVRRSRGARTQALADISFDLQRGDTFGIVGESGSGKTTLARTIVRLVKPDDGTVEFAGRNVAEMKGRALADARRRIQMIYQDPYSSLNPAFTIKQTLAEPMLVHGLVSRNGVDQRVAELINEVGLSQALLSRRPRELSGGQRQRVAIARALATEPEILIADEAVSGLDVSIQAQVIRLLKELQERRGLTLIFVSHQLPVVAQICAQVAVMYRGRIVELGPTQEVFATPRHGYTVALIRATPGHGGGGSAMPRRAIGEAPDAARAGCAFSHRCAFARDDCTKVTPSIVALGETRFARCLVLPHLASSEIRGLLGEADQ